MLIRKFSRYFVIYFNDGILFFLKNIIDFQMAATFVTMYCVIVVSYCYDEFQLSILLKTHVKNVAWNLVQIE